MSAPKTLADLRSLGGKAAQAKRSADERTAIGRDAAAKRWKDHVKVPRDRRKPKPAKEIENSAVPIVVLVESEVLK